MTARDHITPILMDARFSCRIDKRDFDTCNNREPAYGDLWIYYSKFGKKIEHVAVYIDKDSSSKKLELDLNHPTD